MKLKIFTAAVGALFTAAPALAVDAFTTFNGTQGAGDFFYGEAQVSNAANGGAFFANTGPCAIGGSVCLQRSGSNVPGFYKSTTAGEQGTVNVPDDRLIVHTADGPSDVLTAAIYVAPTAGFYQLVASFSVQDDTPSGVDLFSIATTNGGVPLIFTQIGALNAANPTFSFTTGPIFLGASEAFGFGVGNQGDFRFDSTGFDFSVNSVTPGGGNAVPEPATWAMMMIGFGLVGAAARRRRQAYVAA